MANAFMIHFFLPLTVPIVNDPSYSNTKAKVEIEVGMKLWNWRALLNLDHMQVSKAICK